MGDSVTMFQTPLRGRVFSINFDIMEDKPMTDAAVQALGIHKHVGWLSEYTRLLVLDLTSRKLAWVEKEHFTADPFER